VPRGRLGGNRPPPSRGQALVQHHAHHRPPRPLLAVGGALARRTNQPRTVQMNLRHRVAQPVAVTLHQMLVEVLHRKVLVPVPVEPQHPLQLLRRRPPRRGPAQPPVGEPRLPLLLVAVPPAPERALGDAQHLRRLGLRDLAPLVPVQQALKTHPPNSLVDPRPVHRCPHSSGHPRTGQLTSYKFRTDDELTTFKLASAAKCQNWLYSFDRVQLPSPMRAR
jgi:hypothetical protein